MILSKNRVTVDTLIPENREQENKRKVNKTNQITQLRINMKSIIQHTYVAACRTLQFLHTTSRIKNRFIGGCPVGLSSS